MADVIDTADAVVAPAAHTYTLGQSLWFTVRFDQIVEVDSAGGTPRLAIDLNTGGPAYAEYSSGTGSDELWFELVVASGMADPDGITIGALQLNGGTITDEPGNAALLALNSVPLTDGVRVDSPAPGGGTGTPPPGPITIWGTEFDDRLNQFSRDATYMGLEGRDTVVYDGTRADFSIQILPSGTIRLSNDQFSHIHNSIERVEFSDGVLVFDIHGDFVASIYRLYGGAFGRAPDEDGLRFWAGMEDEGLTLESIARIFLGSPEFADRFGSDLSNAALVDMLYENVLGRSGDADGVAFWNAYLDTGGDRSKALLMFTTLPEYVGISEGDITPGFWIA